MSNHHTAPEQQERPDLIQICVKGHLDARWADRFDGLVITLTEDGHTLLTGTVPDQAALYGMLRKVRDLGLPLVSLIPLRPSGEDSATRQGDL